MGVVLDLGIMLGILVLYLFLKLIINWCYYQINSNDIEV